MPRSATLPTAVTNAQKVLPIFQEFSYKIHLKHGSKDVLVASVLGNILIKSTRVQRFDSFRDIEKARTNLQGGKLIN